MRSMLDIVSIENPVDSFTGIDDALFCASWAFVAARIRHRSESWRNTAVPIDPQSTAPNSMRAILAECNSMLRYAERACNVGLSGWEIRVWNPESLRSTGILTLIAVGPDGIGHDIEALALGRYKPAEPKEKT